MTGDRLHPGWAAPPNVKAFTTTRHGGVSSGAWARFNLGTGCGDDPGHVAQNRTLLDKDTSGVMVVARSLRAHTSLVEQIQSRKMSRVYRALAIGNIVAGGTVDAPIGRHPRDRKRMAVVRSGKHAVSHYRVLKRYDGATCLEVALETGRTHQIRVHMAHIGHPLAGDPVYGRAVKTRRGIPDGLVEAIRSFPRQALHAYKLKLTHPGSQLEVGYRAPLPEDLDQLLVALEPFTQ